MLDRFTFRQKIEVFPELLKNVPKLEPLSTNYRRLSEQLQSLNTIRNKYAHGKLFFHEDTPYIESYRSKVREEAMSKEHIKADLRRVGKYKEELSSFVNALVLLIGSKSEAKPS